MIHTVTDIGGLQETRKHGLLGNDFRPVGRLRRLRPTISAKFAALISHDIFETPKLPIEPQRLHPPERGWNRSKEVTEGVVWFLATLSRAIEHAHRSLDGVLMKTRFWQRFAETPMNERQVRLVNRMLDGFEGKLTSGKWAAIAKCSSDTALRDIAELVVRGVLRKAGGGGRSTGYELTDIGSATDLP